MITGASKGIGAQIASLFADAGADIVITGRDATGLEATKQVIEKKGSLCLSLTSDLRTIEGVHYVGQKALDFLGTVDILVNNAGIAHIESLLETTLEHWEETQNLNIRAPFLLAQMVAPKMIEQRCGKIINISSIAAVLAPEGFAAYSVSKAGLNLLTQTMAAEWAQFNIQSNAVAPTTVLTAMSSHFWGDPEKADPMKARIPSNRFGEPHEIADLVLFLASSMSNFICGQVLRIDGGHSAV